MEKKAYPRIILSRNYEFHSDKYFIRKLNPRFFSSLKIQTPLDILFLSQYSHKLKSCHSFQFNFTNVINPDILLVKLHQLSRTFRSIKFHEVSISGLKPLQLKKIFHSQIRSFKFQIEEVPLILFKLSSRTLEFLSLSFYYSGFDFYRQKILKILNTLYIGPKNHTLPILIKIDGLRYDSKFISNLYLASIRLKRRPLHYLINLKYQETSLFEDFDKLGHKIKLHHSSASVADKPLYSKNTYQISNLILNLHHTIQKNYFELVPHLQQLTSLHYLKVQIFTQDAKAAFESFRFPPNLISLEFLLQDGNQKEQQFNYTCQELRGNTERKLRACNLIDRMKYYNEFLNQFKTFEKMKSLRFTISCYYEVNHIYVLFFYALAKRLILPLDHLCVEFLRTESQKQEFGFEYCDFNLPTLLELLQLQKNLLSLEIYCPYYTLDGFKTSKSIFPTSKLSFSPHVLRTNALTDDPKELIGRILSSKLVYLELFRVINPNFFKLIGNKNSLPMIKTLSLIFEIEEQLSVSEVETFLEALKYKKYLRIFRTFMLYQKFDSWEVERIDKVFSSMNSIEIADLQLGASILKKR